MTVHHDGLAGASVSSHRDPARASPSRSAFTHDVLRIPGFLQDAGGEPTNQDSFGSRHIAPRVGLNSSMGLFQRVNADPPSAAHGSRSTGQVSRTDIWTSCTAVGEVRSDLLTVAYCSSVLRDEFEQNRLLLSGTRLRTCPAPHVARFHTAPLVCGPCTWTCSRVQSTLTEHSGDEPPNHEEMIVSADHGYMKSRSPIQELWRIRAQSH